MVASLPLALPNPKPYPNPKNNQRSNAVYFEEKGAAIIQEEKELSPQLLADQVIDILTNNNRREKMAKCSGQLAKPEAGRELADVIAGLKELSR